MRNLLLTTSLFLAIHAFAGCSSDSRSPADDAVSSMDDGEAVGSAAEVQSGITNLDQRDSELVAQFSNQVIAAFMNKALGQIEQLVHPKTVEGEGGNDLVLIRNLMDGGYMVGSWKARPYTEPDLAIMKIVKFHPHPTIWIDLELSNGTRSEPWFFAVSPNSSGELRICNYVDR